MESLFKPSFPHFYRKRSGGRDVSARATHLKAEIGNVSISTTERKQMSTKTTFKRIALVAVAALGLGVLSVAPSQAYVGTPTFTLSSATASAAITETASTTITVNYTSNFAYESMTVRFTSGTSNAGGTPYLMLTNSDSFNVRGGQGQDGKEMAVEATGESVTSVTGGTGATAVQAKFTFAVRDVATVGTHTYTISLLDKNFAAIDAKTFTVTVAAKNTTAVAAKSLMWVNDVGYVGSTYGTFPLRADSTISVTAGDATSPAAVAVLSNTMMNSADTNVVTSTNVGTSESILVVVSGPGLLAHATNRGILSKSMSFTYGETIVVYSDGTAGVLTLTGSIGGVNLTQAAKSKVTFVGKPSTITATLESATVVTGSTATGAISIVIKDSAGNALKALPASQKNTGTPGGVFVLVSDTTVVGPAYTAVTRGATAAYGSSACTYNTSTSNWLCNITITDSGTVSIQIGDSYTAATSVAVSAAVSLKVAGGGFTGTLAFDKSAYAPGEKAIITLTAKDYAGVNVVNGAHTLFAAPTASGQYWGTLTPTFGSGSAFTSVSDYLAATTFVDGVDTAIVYMPSVAGTYTWSATTNGVDKKAVTTSFTVVDPNAAVIAAAKDAADAATDAALEATDAAYAATDAANIAAEAADAATAAAEAAKESADAATAAVEELATSVAKLMAALQAQITTLAKVVAKIAVKVKA